MARRPLCRAISLVLACALRARAADVPKFQFVKSADAASPASPADAPLGRADWGGWTAADLARRVATGQPADDVTGTTKRVVQVAVQSLSDAVAPAAQLNFQGIVFSDPRYQASLQAIKSVPEIYAWAMCGRVAGAPTAASCLSKASDAALAWAAAYKPTGDPINEGRLVPLLLAIDLLEPAIPDDQRGSLIAWAASLAAAGDSLSASWRPGDGRRSNNWTAWRLLVRGVAAEVAGDAGLKASTRAEVSAFVSANIQDDGSTFDFHQRDALHYHVYDLTPLVELELYSPELVDAAASARIGKGLEFLRPFYTGQARHVEFAHTTVSFDITRRDAGDPSFQNAPWDPSSARELLRYALVAHPSIASWAGSVVDPNYSPMLKQLAALHAAR